MIAEIDWNGMWKELMQNASWSRRRRSSDVIEFEEDGTLWSTCEMTSTIHDRVKARRCTV